MLWRFGLVLTVLCLLGGCAAPPSAPTVTPVVVGQALVLTATPTPRAAAEPPPTAAPTPLSSPTPTALATSAAAPTSTPTPTLTPTRLPPSPGPPPTRTYTPLPAATPPPAPTAAASAGPAGAPLVVLDPGHGGDEIGAAYSAGGLVLREKDVNLSIAQRLSGLLRAAGYRVQLTRQGDTGVNLPARDLTGDGRIDTTDDLQARIDLANASGAQLLFSIHNNGSTSPSESGSEVYYCPERSYADRNLTLAKLLQSAFGQRLAEAGYRTRDRGVKPDTGFRYYDGLPYCASLLGPAQLPRRPRGTQMPAALGESLFLSHPEGALLARDDILQGIAQAYFDAAKGYFARYPAP